MSRADDMMSSAPASDIEGGAPVRHKLALSDE